MEQVNKNKRKLATASQVSLISLTTFPFKGSSDVLGGLYREGCRRGECNILCGDGWSKRVSVLQ